MHAWMLMWKPNFSTRDGSFQPGCNLLEIMPQDPEASSPEGPMKYFVLPDGDCLETKT